MNLPQKDRPLTADDITWHAPRFSAQRPNRPLTYDELWTISEIENVLATLTQSETACWIRDILDDYAASKVGLRACMDALHAAQQLAPKRNA